MHVVVVINVEQGIVTVVKKVVSRSFETEFNDADEDVAGTTSVMEDDNNLLADFEGKTDDLSKVTTLLVETAVS